MIDPKKDYKQIDCENFILKLLILEFQLWSFKMKNY